MNTKHQVLNRKMNLVLLLKPNICKCKNKKKTTSQTEVHITKISQSSHDRKTGHACCMTKKVHILINLGQSDDETSLNSMRI